MKNIVFIPAVVIPGMETRSASYEWGIKSWKVWCDKNDCELFILSELLCPVETMKITWQRYYVFDLLEASGIDYAQVLMVDADTVIHPDCPNFFNLTDNKFTGVAVDGSYDWLFRSMENYSKHLFNDKWFNFWEYYQGGFQIVNVAHKPFYKSILNFYIENKPLIDQLQTFHVGTDQPVVNFLLREHNIDLKLLDWTFSMSDIANKELLDDELTFTSIPGVYQFNAIPNNVNNMLTHKFMEAAYKKLYL